MSVLIKGMEMPKHCWQCPFHDDMDDCILLNQSCMKVWGETKHLDDCPLVEVPTPHGRLIDADALMQGAQYKGRYDIVNAYDIINAPTILEAEVEG